MVSCYTLYMKLKNTLGITSYIWFGGGFNTYSHTQPEVKGVDLVLGDKRVSSIHATHMFKQHRFFVDNWQMVKPEKPLTLITEPNKQHFWVDSYLKLCKDNGVETIYATAGNFDWTVMPINPSTGKSYSQRKSMTYDPALDPTKPETWDEYAEYCRQIVEYYNGKGLLDYLELGNEWNFKWNVPHTVTEEEYAVCLKRVFDVVMPINSTVKIAMGGGISPSLSQFQRIITKLKTLYGEEGSEMPTNWYLNFHWYMRDTSQDQSGGTKGITPEEAKAYEFGKQLDALCEEHGLIGWMCTETGWATDTSKQSAPILEGYTQEQSQGILMTRLALLWGACKHCVGNTFWHCRDDYDAPPYAKGGVNYKDWTAKPSQGICEEFINKYGELEVIGFTQGEGVYQATLSNGKKLTWSDKVNKGNVTPMPQELDVVVDPEEPPVPPTPTTMKLFYSTKADKSDAQELTNNLPSVGAYYIEAKEITAPVVFTLSLGGAVVKTQTENGAPFDLAGGQPVSFIEGTYTLVVKEKTETKTYTIVVGNVTPPPEPEQEIVDITVTKSDNVVVKVNGAVI